MGVCRLFPQIPTLLQTKKCNFPHPFSDQTSKIHTRFQTWALGRNYVIITYIRAQTNKFFKFISNSHIFLFLSYSFGMEAINFSYIPVVPSKTIPDSRLKWVECIPVFRPKRPKNPTRWGGTYLYGIPRNRRNSRYSHCFCLLGVQTKFIQQIKSIMQVILFRQTHEIVYNV